MSVPFIESLLSAKIKALLIAGIPAVDEDTPGTAPVTFPVVTFWESRPDGEVKQDTRSKISIGITTRGYTDQLGWSASLTGWIAVESDAPDTAALTAEYERMINIIEGWQHAAPGASVGSLNVSGFDVDDFQIVPGGDCGFDPNLDLFFAVISFELDGTLTTR